MTYKLNGSNLIFAITRAEILDISPGDIISVDGFEGVTYRWTEHDSDFLENNPDADIFLQVARDKKNEYRASGILLKEPVS